jgi:hypothetical protein
VLDRAVVKIASSRFPDREVPNTGRFNRPGGGGGVGGGGRQERRRT